MVVDGVYYNPDRIWFYIGLFVAFACIISYIIYSLKNKKVDDKDVQHWHGSCGRSSTQLKKSRRFVTETYITGTRTGPVMSRRFNDFNNKRN